MFSPSSPCQATLLLLAFCLLLQPELSYRYSPELCAPREGTETVPTHFAPYSTPARIALTPTNSPTRPPPPTHIHTPTQESIDVAMFKTTVISRTYADRHPYPSDGAYLCGLYLEGARWCADRAALCEPEPKVLFSSMPPVCIVAPCTALLCLLLCCVMCCVLPSCRGKQTSLLFHVLINSFPKSEPIPILIPRMLYCRSTSSQSSGYEHGAGVWFVQRYNPLFPTCDNLFFGHAV
jgi:hypothetical protein